MAPPVTCPSELQGLDPSVTESRRGRNVGRGHEGSIPVHSVVIPHPRIGAVPRRSIFTGEQLTQGPIGIVDDERQRRLGHGRAEGQGQGHEHDGEAQPSGLLAMGGYRARYIFPWAWESGITALPSRGSRQGLTDSVPCARRAGCCAEFGQERAGYTRHSIRS
jgi:hypothetical protein